MSQDREELNIFEDPAHTPHQGLAQPQLIAVPAVMLRGIPAPPMLPPMSFPVLMSTVMPAQPPPPPPRTDTVIPPPPPMPSSNAAPSPTNPYMIAVMESVHSIAPPTAVPAVPAKPAKATKAGTKSPVTKPSAASTPKAKKEPKEPKEPKSPKEPKEPKKPKQAKQPKEAKEGGVAGPEGLKPPKKPRVSKVAAEKVSNAHGNGPSSDAPGAIDGAAKTEGSSTTPKCSKKRAAEPKDKAENGEKVKRQRKKKEKEKNEGAEGEGGNSASNEKKTKSRTKAGEGKTKSKEGADRVTAVTENVMEEEEEEAYVKLECMDLNTNERFVRYVKTLPCIIGRLKPKKGGEERSNFVPLNSNPKISEEHAEIGFNHKTGFFTIKIFGKTLGLVRGEKVERMSRKGDTCIELHSRDPVKLGDVAFYFCLPELERPKKQFVELVVEALESHKARGIMQLSAKEIARYIIEQYGFYNVQHGNERGIQGLIRSIQNAISKSDKVRSTAKDKSGRALYELGLKTTKAKAPKEGVSDVGVNAGSPEVNATETVAEPSTVDS